MRLGKRSARERDGGRRQLIRLAALLLLLAGPAAAHVPSDTVGPARIVCNASFCEMGSGARPRQRVRVIVSNLPHEEIRRLRKCTGVAHPCIVTIEGARQGGPTRLMATAIQWQD